jgi:amino acid transporter
LASCLAVQASGSRLLFVMGRDGVLPRKVFGFLHDRFRTPVLNLLIIAVIGVGGMFLTVGDATSLINFGAFLAFTVANVCVIVLFLAKRKSMSREAGVLGFVILPVLGIVVDLYLLFSLSGLALTIGAVWLVVGCVYLAVLTRGFSRPAPAVDMADVEQTAGDADASIRK